MSKPDINLVRRELLGPICEQCRDHPDPYYLEKWTSSGSPFNAVEFSPYHELGKEWTCNARYPGDARVECILDFDKRRLHSQHSGFLLGHGWCPQLSEDEQKKIWSEPATLVYWDNFDYDPPEPTEKAKRNGRVQMNQIVDKIAKLSRVPGRDLDFMSLAPRRYRDANLEKDLIEGAHRKKLLKWVAGSIEKGERKNLLLLGVPGAGKTHLAFATFRHLITRAGFDPHSPYWLEFTRAESLLASLRPGHERAENDGPTLAERASMAEIFILDDLGSETMTEWGRSQILGVVDDRYRAQRPIITTSNMLVDEFRETLDKRLARRLIDDAEVIVFTESFSMTAVNAQEDRGLVGPALAQHLQEEADKLS